MPQNREWTHSTNKVPSHSLPWFSALYYSGLADRWRKLPRRRVEARQNEIGKLNATGGFLKVFGVQNGKFVVVMSQGINFVVTSQRIFHFGRLDAIK